MPRRKRATAPRPQGPDWVEAVAAAFDAARAQAPAGQPVPEQVQAACIAEVAGAAGASAPASASAAEE
eukprot:11173573-Lingulodinium_polyedra.AAC.1